MPRQRLAELKRYLQRTTNSGRLIPEVEGLRFVAIGSVVIYHLNGYLVTKSPLQAQAATSWIAGIASTGHCGVGLFFIVSGFILALPWLANEQLPRLRPYFLRRLTRLEPPYLLSLLGLTFAYYLTKRPFRNDVIRHLVPSFFYLHSTVFGAPSPVNCVTWSLEVEIQFYTLLPLLALATFRSRSSTRRALLVTLLLLAWLISFLVRDSSRLALSLLGSSQYFFVGILIADFYRGWLSLPRSYAWDALGVLGFALVPTADLRWPGSLGILSFPLLLGLSLIFISALRGRLIGRMLATPPLVVTGGMCYTIYLLHYPLISFAGRHTLHVGENLTYPAYLLVQTVLILSLIALPIVTFFVCVERPCMHRDWPVRLAAWVLGTKPPSRDTEASNVTCRRDTS